MRTAFRWFTKPFDAVCCCVCESVLVRDVESIEYIRSVELFSGQGFDSRNMFTHYFFSASWRTFRICPLLVLVFYFIFICS